MITSLKFGGTCDSVWPRLACTWTSCVQFDQAQISTQLNASFSSFGHPTQVDASWSQDRSHWYERARKPVLKWLFFVPTCIQLECSCIPFGHPSQEYAAQVGISKLTMTCDSLRPEFYSSSLSADCLVSSVSRLPDYRGLGGRLEFPPDHHQLAVLKILFQYCLTCSYALTNIDI